MNTFRKMPGAACGAVAWAALLFPPRAVAQTYTPAPITPAQYSLSPYQYTGIVTTPKQAGFAFGSGAVVKSPRVVYSCAHIVYDSTLVSPWLIGSRWFLRHGISQLPPFGGQPLRSYHHFAGYSTSAQINQSSPASFQQDFVVHYAYEDTAGGTYAGSYDEGSSHLMSNRPKLITGYPMGNYINGAANQFQLHATGPFGRAFGVRLESYHGATDVSTGPGNSGGPVWVFDGTEYKYAGLLLSGQERAAGGPSDSIGVYALESASATLIDAAISDTRLSPVPTIIEQPSSRRVVAGHSTTFTVAAYAYGDTRLEYYWQSGNGNRIAGATNSTLILSNVAPGDAGSYQAVALNEHGVAFSRVVTLSVDSAPTISIQPAAQTLILGRNTSLSVSAQSTTAMTYQWHCDGAAIPGGTKATLTLTDTNTSNSGNYSVTITNAVGAVTSHTAVLATRASAPIPRISNLSVLTRLTAANPFFTVGTVIGGGDTSGAKALLVRGAGPSLAQFGVTGVSDDPTLSFYSGQRLMIANDDWGGDLPLAAAFTRVAAFPYMSASSRDAAAYNAAVAAGNYTMQIGGRAGSLGTVIAELYDATPEAAFTTSTPRLINVSVLKQIDAGEILTIGFVVGGGASKEIMIRAVGPTLSLPPFNIAGMVGDPKLELFLGQSVMTANNDWGSDSALVAAFARLGAFPFASARDAALVVSVQPGNYTVQVSGFNGASGLTLVEVYEVP